MMKEEIMEADVLCVGGGIAGLMAGIRAAELGAKVIIADKANTLRSGAGATGNDHFRCYIPEVHGTDVQPVIDEITHSQAGGSGARPVSFIRAWMEKSFDIVKLWHSWGIPMQYEGKWEFAGHGLPGKPLTAMKYAGQNQKPILTREALKKGARIVNRTMIFDLLTDARGAVTGAIGIDTREDKLIIFKAKSVILSTGICNMLYPGPTPGWMFNRANPPSTTGDGRAMAYRAGAELVGMEIPQRWAGPKYFARCGKATWIGVVRGPDGKAVSPIITKPERRYGDIIADAYHSLFEDFARAGKGPVYMDCRGISDDDFDYMMHWLKNEGNVALINHLKEENIDIKNNAVEFMTYEMTTRGGILYNAKTETSVKGLYAAGDEFFGGISPAATFGWIAGDSAAVYAASTELPDIEQAKGTISQKKNLLSEIQQRDKGPSWQEVNIALQQIMYDYAGTIRSESSLQAGLSHLSRLKKKAYAGIQAKNRHELTHSLEVLNLFDIAELVFTAIIERKESRGNYARIDYPFTNPMLNNKMLICKKADDKPVIEWR
jgi:succinate dehydrogenase/fumarate reductase flavoprotein subunit